MGCCFFAFPWLPLELLSKGQSFVFCPTFVEFSPSRRLQLLLLDTVSIGAPTYTNAAHIQHTRTQSTSFEEGRKKPPTHSEQIVQSYSPSFGWPLRCRQWSSIFSINFAALGQFRPLACAKAISISKCISPLVRLPSVENPP